MRFLKQENWGGLPFPSPGDLPDPGIKPACPALAGRFFTTEPLGKHLGHNYTQNFTRPKFILYWVSFTLPGVPTSG